MYEVEGTELNASQSFGICYACLCTTRKTVFLGEYAGVFNRVIYLNNEDSSKIKVCWECLAMLKKIKLFEAKCYTAQRILQTKWENHQPPKCLSALVMTPVKLDVHFGVKFAETEHGFKFQETCTANNSNATLNYTCTRNEEQSSRFEESASLDSPPDKLDHYFEYFNRNKAGNDYLFNKKGVKPVGDVDIEIKNIDCKDTFNSSNSSLSSDCKQESEKLSNTDTYKLNNGKLTRRKGLKKKDLEDHFRIVAVTVNKMKQFKSKCQIDIGELQFWRQTERFIDIYRDELFKCQNCICAFSSVKKKIEHDKKYHDATSGVYTCDVCTSRFADKDSLAAHVAKHYSLHRCDLCQFRCISRRVIKLHMRRHKRLVTCVHCEAGFATVGLFYKHYKANHAVFICDHCGKKCRTKYTLEKHIRHHSETNVCHICNKVYASRNSLRNHSDMKHKAGSGEMAYCVKCDKQFPNVPLYRRHVQSSKAHAAERDADGSKKQVCCPICGNVYSRKTYMMNHYRHVHMKQSKHYCTDCDRHFLNRTRYVEHRKYHHEGETKVKNKMCNICGRGFAANRTLVNHIRTHSGERPYECQYCDAKFTQKHGMLSHIKYIHMKSKRRAFQ